MGFTKKEIKILSFFEHAFDKEKGIDYLLSKGFKKDELITIISKLKEGNNLDEVETPNGLMLCTLYINFSIHEFSGMKREFGLAED